MNFMEAEVPARRRWVWIHQPIPRYHGIICAILALVLGVAATVGTYYWLGLNKPSPAVISAQPTTIAVPKANPPVVATTAPAPVEMFKSHPAAKGDTFSDLVYELYGDGRIHAYTAASEKAIGIDKDHL